MSAYVLHESYDSAICQPNYPFLSRKYQMIHEEHMLK